MRYVATRSGGWRTRDGARSPGVRPATDRTVPQRARRRRPDEAVSANPPARQSGGGKARATPPRHVDLAPMRRVVWRRGGDGVTGATTRAGVVRHAGGGRRRAGTTASARPRAVGDVVGRGEDTCGLACEGTTLAHTTLPPLWADRGAPGAAAGIDRAYVDRSCLRHPPRWREHRRSHEGDDHQGEYI